MRKVKVLLLHGFTGAPDELAYLVERFEAAGYQTETPCLPGHVPDAPDLTTAGADEWLGAARSALGHLGPLPGPVVGFSMGALLALCLAAEQPDRVSALALLAPALELTRPAAILGRTFRTLPFLRRTIPRLPKWGGRDLRDPAQRARFPGWGSVPTYGLSELCGLQLRALAAAGSVRCPVQILVAEKDRTVAAPGISRLARRLSVPVEIQSFKKSGHQLALDYQRVEVAESLLRFLKRIPQG
jgi:carboxylesterase